MNKLPELIKLIHIAHDEDAFRSSKNIYLNGSPLLFDNSYYDKKIKELKKERTDILKTLPLKNLTSTEKEIFNLRFIKGKAVRAIAKKMHYSPSTIHHKIARISEKLNV